MTEEEARQEYEERQRLIAELERLQNELRNLIRERDYLYEELQRSANMAIGAISNASGLATHVIPRLEKIEETAGYASDYSAQVLSAIQDVENRYFLIKNVSTASKKLTELDDIYQRKFRFYSKLRKITLGYVIGIDKNIISNETLRKTVEENQLLNSDYWVSYALSSVMLWISDEKEASQRALVNSLKLDAYKSYLFFMLVNLRFGRQEAARKWYELYSRELDILDIGSEFEYILEAYLHHAFGQDKEFESQVREKFNELLTQMRESYSNYDNRIVNRVLTFADSFAHSTDKSYDLLQENCLDYTQLLSLMTKVEKEFQLAMYYKSVLDNTDNRVITLSENIENILYNLVSAYDAEEYEIIKQTKYYEYVVKARGDIEEAKKMYQAQILQYEDKITLDELIFKFAFSDIKDNVDNKIRRFAITFLLPQIKQGYKDYHATLLRHTNNMYNFNIDGCKVKVNDTNINDGRKEINLYYKKNQAKFLMQDKKYKTLLITSIISLSLTVILTLLIAFVFKEFNVVTAILFGIFVLLTILFGVLWFLRRAKTIKMIERKKMESLKKYNDVMEAFKVWKKDFEDGLLNQELLQNTLDLFGNEGGTK